MEKINKLKKKLKREKIDGYLVPKNDEFFGEYTPTKNDRLNYISGFSGSYGFALILRNKSYLFVDGRYTLQANKQSGKNFKVVTIPNKMPSNILKNRKYLIGFDPKLFTKTTLKTFFSKSNCKLKPLNNNLIDEIWTRKIKKNSNKFYCLPSHSVGSSYQLKIKKVIENLKRKKADFQFITASENNAWLLNVRGNDTEFSPIPHSYILISKNKKIKFFCNLNKISSSVRRSLRNIEFVQIQKTFTFLSDINDKKFIIDKNTCSVFFEDIVSKNNKIINFQDPIYNLKAIKSKKEIANTKLAHIRDGAALTKYLFWIKNNFDKKRITEISASNKLFELRKKNKNFKSLSFPTISGSGPNGSIIHYKASKRSNRELKKGDIYLVDSGGQYEFGTTDVTRTLSLNNCNERIKNIFTRVLKGHIAVTKFNLKNHTKGFSIDKAARKYLKQINLDYAHGTGHGVGYYLNVHEGPHAISKKNKFTFKEGMVVSNEPGYYEKNNFGIRIENLIYVKKDNNKIFFENLTMVPIDKNLIDFNILNKKEKDWLNNYHKKVFSCLKKYMNKTEIIELRMACSAI